MTRSLRWLITPAVAMTLAAPTLASTVSVDEARSLATEFLSQKGGTAIAVSETPVHIAGTATSPLYYVFNSADGGAFVIISAEDTTIPVLGYSLEGGYAAQGIPTSMQWMLEGLQREIKAAPELQSSLSLTERRNLARRSGAKAAQKLLETPNWSQEGPFNNLIPGRPLVGCVGTAMSTIMRYHSWPAIGSGSFGGVDFNTAYDWGNMRMDNYRGSYTETEADAVATLMYHTSKSIDTQYAMSGSSAYEVRVPWALSTYFGYDPGVSYKKRAEVSTQQEWDNIVKAEIDAGRPVLYCGQDVTAGHAFVCDGYDGDYLHINWGWGGSANAYFLSTALNPTVSRTHSYNNLNTIIYNIRPASGEITDWATLHITSDGNQAGIGSDLTDLSNGKTFTVRVGNLKNLSYDDFNGKIAVALCASNGSVRALLSPEQNLSLPSMATLYNGFAEFRNNCKLPSGTTVADGDAVRIVAKANGSDRWLPVAGELLTVNQLQPSTSPATFSVTLAGNPTGATMEGEPTVIRGWDYKFKATLADPVNDVLTVKANGYVLTPDANNVYTISNVRENQQISLIVQKAADVKEKRNIWVGTPGTLQSIISEEESGVIKDLTLFGSIDANDFAFMRDHMRLERLDLTGVYIAANGSNQANAIPREAFRGCGNLKEVILPNSVNRLNNGCFRQCGITKITIPANVKTYEYNVFVAASALRDIYVGRETAEFINWCVLSGVKVDLVTLHVPSERAVTNYSKAENWNTIKNIIVDPIPATTDALFAIQDDNNVNFESATAPGRVAPGTVVNFTADYVAENDNRMEVYANSTLLTPNADGVYTATVSGNTIIHFDLVAPIATDEAKSQWKLTGANGSIGMLSEAVNVIPGQEFTVRLNALEIPQYFDQLYWAVALTDANDNIKEFISPVNVWSAGAGNNHKLNVKCKVTDSKVREGNKLRVVTSGNRRNWNIVRGANEEIVDELQALNNMTPVYNITIPAVEGVNVSGASATAIRGMDMTIKMVPVNPAYRLNVFANGNKIAGNSMSVNYPFVALEDTEFEIEVFDPKAGGVAEFTVAPGTFNNQLTADNVAETVIVRGEMYSLDIQAATQHKFAAETIKVLDLSGVTIVQNGGNEANVISHAFFVPTNSINPTYPSVVEQIILPNSVVRIEGGVFQNCKNIKEFTLPESLISIPVYVPGYGNKYGLVAGDNNFDPNKGEYPGIFYGLDNLTTLRIPGTPQQQNGEYIVAHFSPFCTAYVGTANYEMFKSWYTLGHKDAKKVTIIVPEEYLSVYRTQRNDSKLGNPWYAHGYNILSENPVYGLIFDQTRIDADEDLDLQKTASFLGDDVAVVSKTIEGKIRLHNPDVNCKVYDNGQEVAVAEDGTIPVTFYNPAKNALLSGNHELSVVYLYDVNFATSSPLFKIENPEVTNEADLHTESFEAAEDGASHVLRNVAENSTVKFRVGFNTEHNEGLDVHVMLGQQQLEADEEGYYTVSVTNAARELAISAVPGEGAVLNAEELSTINPADAAGISSIALSGELTPEQLSDAMDMFANLENLDLSGLEGELPANAFAGLDNLNQVVLPEVEHISEGLFNGCTSLQTIEIPSSVNSVGADAFKGCESLETVRFTGVDEIGDGAFDGCNSLTSITLLSNNTSHNGAAKPRRVNVSADAFRGVNPNCIVVLDEGVAMPAAEANYLTTASGMISETQPDGSVIEREGRSYSAGGDIAFTTGYPLAIPHSFSFNEHQSVTLATNLGGYNTLTIPFDVKSVELEDGSAVDVVVAAQNGENTRRYAGRTSDRPVISVYGAEADTEGLKAQSSVKANTPYVTVSSKNAGYVFRAAEGNVASTPKEIVSAGKDFELHASYASTEHAAHETYLLGEGGGTFDKAGTEEDEAVEVKPFRVYATSSVGANQIETLIPGSVVTGVEGVEVEGVRIIRDGASLIIDADEAGELKIYAVDGRLVRVLKLTAGRNVTDSPEPGVYVIGSTRVRF